MCIRDRYLLSQDLLLGEPGDTVDLSSISSPGNNKGIIEGLKEFSIDSTAVSTTTESIHYAIQVKSITNVTSHTTSVSKEKKGRSVSDGVLDAKQKSKGKNKKKSKLSVFMNFFK